MLFHSLFLKTNPLARSVVWFWRTMWRLTTRTSPLTWLTSSNENASTTSEIHRRLSELRSVRVWQKGEGGRGGRKAKEALPCSDCESVCHVGGWLVTQKSCCVGARKRFLQMFIAEEGYVVLNRVIQNCQLQVYLIYFLSSSWRDFDHNYSL